MPNESRPTIWGRPNSVNVQKVLWCTAELGLAYDRIDAGMQFGRNTESDYLAMNPNGRIPTLVDGDFVLWESNAIMRYLCLAYGADAPIYPKRPRQRASVERWLDWTLSTVQPVERPVFWGLIRTPPEQRDMAMLQKGADEAAALWRILDAHLETRRYVEAEIFTLADIALGAFARRWFGLEGIEKPELPHLSRWYRALSGPAGLHPARRSTALVSAQRRHRHDQRRSELPASMLAAPPTFTQVSVPGSFAKLGP